jgi:hypothetical protein
MGKCGVYREIEPAAPAGKLATGQESEVGAVQLDNFRACNGQTSPVRRSAYPCPGASRHTQSQTPHDRKLDEKAVQMLNEEEAVPPGHGLVVGTGRRQSRLGGGSPRP